jgi:hypothetical protein
MIGPGRRIESECDPQRVIRRLGIVDGDCQAACGRFASDFLDSETTWPGDRVAKGQREDFRIGRMKPYQWCQQQDGKN